MELLGKEHDQIHDHKRMTEEHNKLSRNLQNVKEFQMKKMLVSLAFHLVVVKLIDARKECLFYLYLINHAWILDPLQGYPYMYNYLITHSQFLLTFIVGVCLFALDLPKANIELFYRGNKNCLRCRQLEGELLDLKTSMMQLQSKYSREKQDWEERKQGKTIEKPC